LIDVLIYSAAQLPAREFNKLTYLLKNRSDRDWSEFSWMRRRRNFINWSDGGICFHRLGRWRWRG